MSGNPYEIEPVKFVASDRSAIERIEALESQIAILTDLTCNLQSQCKQHEYFIEQLLKLDTSETSA